MSVSITAPTGSTLSEYVAQAINFQVQDQPDANGHYQRVFTAFLPYVRKDWLVDASGNKLAIINPPGVHPVDKNGADVYYGNISLSAADLAALDATVPTTSGLTWIAAQADAKIQADLTARGILA